MENLLHILLSQRAAQLGFIACGATPVTRMSADSKYLAKYLEKGRNGDMHYMAKNQNIRENPSLLLDEAKSIVAVLAPYNPYKKQSSDYPQIASYAYGLDYHPVIKERLRKLAAFIGEHYKNFKYRVFTDSAPIFERSIAARAGLGFIGKNTFLINQQYGLHTFIGIIICNVKLEYNNNLLTNRCGSCTRCIDACPSGAIVAPFELDATKCISYITIESKSVGCGGNHIFGCDICMDVCPWDKKAAPLCWDQFKPLEFDNGKNSITLSAQDWLNMEEADFSNNFDKSSLKRAGLEKIKKNLKDEMANRG